MQSRPRSSLRASLVIFAGFFAFFLALRTNDFSALDGALRCLSVLYEGQRFHANNHMLYPFWVGVWANLNGWLGIRAQDAVQFVHMSQGLNAFGAAASIACLYYLIESVSTTLAAISGCLIFGLSHTVLLQATASDEPVIGLFFAMLSLALLAWGIHNSNIAALLAAGLSLAAAFASYQTMAAAAGPAFLMCLYWPVAAGVKPLSARRRVLAAASGSAVGVIAIYSWAYHAQGVPASHMLARFLTADGGASVYTGPELIPSKTFNTTFGFLMWFFGAVPDDYSGMHNFLKHSHAGLWMASILGAVLFLGLTFWLAGKAWRAASSARPNRFLLIAVLIFLTLPNWAWGPVNAKMWLLPIACLSFFLTVGWARGGLPPSLHRVLTVCLATCVLIEAVRDIPPVVRDHANPTPGMAYAEEVAHAIHPDDWVVLDFDDVSGLWMGFWGYKTKTLMLPSSTLPELGGWLEQAKAATGHGQGRLLFLNVLQTNKEDWDVFLGARVRIPYEFLDPYRKSSTILVAPKDPRYHAALLQYLPAAQ